MKNCINELLKFWANCYQATPKQNNNKENESRGGAKNERRK